MGFRLKYLRLTLAYFKDVDSEISQADNLLEFY